MAKKEQAPQVSTPFDAMQRRVTPDIAVFMTEAWDMERYVKAAIDAWDKHALFGIEFGKRMLVIQHFCTKEEYRVVKQKIGISESTLWRYMAIAKSFAQLDPELVKELGNSKLYAMLKAPKAETHNLLENGTFLGVEKEDLAALDLKELHRLIDERLGKLKEDLADERSKAEILHKEKVERDRRIDELTAQVQKLKTGQSAGDPLPSWWPAFSSFMAAGQELARSVAADPPNLRDETTAARCAFLMKSLNATLARINEHLGRFPISLVEFNDATEERLAKLDQDARYDWNKL